LDKFTFFRSNFYISSAFETIWGFSANALYQNPKAWFNKVHADDQKKLIDFIKNNNTLDVEVNYPIFRILNGDKSIRWLRAKSYPILDTYGVTTRIAGIAEDITERQAVDETLYKTEYLLQSVIDNSPTLIYAKDLNAHFTLANKQFGIITNTPQKEIIGKNMFDIFTNQNAKHIWENDNEAITQSNSTVYDESYQHADGSTHHYLSVKFPLLNEKQEIYNICSISIDVTEHLITKEKLNIYEQIINSSNDLMAYIDKNYTLQAVNNHYVNIYSYTATDIEGKTVEEIIGKRLFDSKLKCQLERCFTGHFVQFQQWFDLPILGKKFLDISIIPHRSKSGDVDGAIIDVHDSTSMKNTETELNQHKENLEDLVTQRTTALEAVNKELEAYSYSIAHDLRAPLRSVTSFSQIILEEGIDKLNKQEQSYLNRIINAAKNMADLIDDILELARISRSQFTLETVDLSELSRKILDSLKDQFPKRNVDITIDQALNVKADAALMKVALDNLIGNAWKYTGKKSNAQIHIGLSKQTKSNKPDTNTANVFYITDNGAGFDMQYADNLFKPFKRLHNKDDFDGTGIGLATVQRIIQRHGGEVWCNSKLGKGSTFYFTLTDNI